jgi:hypothetical protein
MPSNEKKSGGKIRKERKEKKERENRNRKVIMREKQISVQ